VAENDAPAKSLPGGYARAEVEKDVKAAAEFAVRDQAKREAIPLKLATIFKAEKQIVAGLNYRRFLWSSGMDRREKQRRSCFET
jgi:hypothetical protein